MRQYVDETRVILVETKEGKKKAILICDFDETDRRTELKLKELYEDGTRGELNAIIMEVQHGVEITNKALLHLTKHELSDLFVALGHKRDTLLRYKHDGFSSAISLLVATISAEINSREKKLREAIKELNRLKMSSQIDAFKK